uniref:RBL n=1 Tax=Hypocrea rufa TaxID=5547 RepID=A0A0A7ME97_HYPRU|nr:RBL [Trichoderma viride]
MSLFEGTYIIRSALSQHKPVDLEASNPTGRLIQYTFHGGPNQQWRISHVGNDEFSIQNVATGTYAAAQNGNNTVIRAARTNPQGDASARWKFVRANASSDTWYIRNVAYNSKTFDVTASNQADLTEILAYSYHGGLNQQFTFTRLGC